MTSVAFDELERLPELLAGRPLGVPLAAVALFGRSNDSVVAGDGRPSPAVCRLVDADVLEVHTEHRIPVDDVTAGLV